MFKARGILFVCYSLMISEPFCKLSSTKEKYMKQTPEQLLKWELARERFHLEDPFPPPERRTEKCISTILSEMFKKDEADDVSLPEKIIDRWPVIVGEQLAQHTRPSHLKKGILYIHADHPGWLAELRRLPKIHILKKLSLVPDLPEIKDIRFQLDSAIRNFKK
jgi:hypothetical protein